MAKLYLTVCLKNNQEIKMDLRKLITKIDKIESKKILTETATKAKTSESRYGYGNGRDYDDDVDGSRRSRRYGEPRTTRADKEHNAKLGDISGKKEAPRRTLAQMADDAKKKSDSSTKESLAQRLLKEFGLEEATNPWQGSDPARAAAWSKLTQKDQAWMGGADPTDPNILRRAPNKGQPASQAAAPAAQAAQTAAPVQGAQSTPVAPQGDVQGTPLPPATSIDPADMGQGIGGGQAAPAAGQSGQQSAPAAATPAGSRPSRTSDPAVKALQQRLQKLDPAITVDGIMGPKTRAALQRFPQAAQQSTQATARAADKETTPIPTQATARAADNQMPPPAPIAAQIPATADKKQPYWVNGTRFEYKSIAANRGRPASGKWEVTHNPTDKLAWNDTRKRSRAKYTGPDNAFNSGKKAAPVQFPAQPTATNESDDQILQMIKSIKY